MRLRLLLIVPLVLLVCLQPGGAGVIEAAAPMFGDGSDGGKTFVSDGQLTPPVYAAVTSGSAGTSTLAVSGMVAVPPLTEFVSGQRIVIHQTRGGAAGAWELAQVQSYALGNVFTVDPLVNSYSSSGIDRAQILVVPEYTDVTVNAGVTVSAMPWNGSTGGILAILANGASAVNGTISAVGAGYEGGPSVGSNSAAFAGGSQCRPPFQVVPGDEGGCNGGRGDRNFTAASGAGGGGGANGTDGGQGWAGGGQPGPTGGSTSGTFDLTSATFGGGGAGGSGGNDGISGYGGRGGGLVFVGASTLTVNGAITANGQVGGAGTFDDSTSSAGGGGGGSVLLRFGTGLFAGVIAACGGNGGTQGQGGQGGVGGSGSCTTAPGGNGTYDGGGGGGGAGRIRAEFCTGISGGTSNPPASVAQIPCAPPPSCIPYDDCDHDAAYSTYYGDGCPDSEEPTKIYHSNADYPLDPNNPWDFYSVPVPALFAPGDPTTRFRDNVVTAGDAQAIFAYFARGARTGTLEYEQDLNLNGVRDGIEYDHAVTGPGLPGAPAGAISASEAQKAFSEFNSALSCTSGIGYRKNGP